MNTKLSFSILLTALVLMLGSCKKFLDVQPEASYTEVQVYDNEAAIQQAFNGLYLDMASPNLYGAYMSTTILEMMAQRYKSLASPQEGIFYPAFNNYDYGSYSSETIFDSLWRKGYSTVLATNVFLSKIDQCINAGIISTQNGQLLKGEAVAIRALVHFDLLRLFGPVWQLGNATAAIPYYTMADGKAQPILTATAVMDKVLADLSEAEALLTNDPVKTTGVVFNNNFYTGARNQRLNYYAVKALKSRALLWAGKGTEANAEAKKVLEEGEKWFAWIEAPAVTTAINPDRVFAPEILFGLYVPQQYNTYDHFFNPSLNDNAVLTPSDFRLNETFEGLQQDYRFIQTWLFGAGRSNRTFFKYAPLQTITNWRFIQPLLRKSELYYILAETETDPAKALDYLNTARRRRGLANLANAPTIATEIRKEYQKEFWGEGQLFFYYKRTNDPSVPSADMPYWWATTQPNYNVPLPLSETITR